MQCTFALAFHHIDVFNRDGTAVPVEDHEDGQTDSSFRRCNRENQHGEDLPHQVPKEGRESDKIDVDGQKQQLDRHQNDDHVLSVQKRSRKSRL